MQHAGGAGGGAGVPKRRAAGEGEAVGGLERSPGGWKKPSWETHQRPAETAGQWEAEQVWNVLTVCHYTQEWLHYDVPQTLKCIDIVRLVNVLVTGCVQTSAAVSLARQWSWQSKSTRLRYWPYSRPWRSKDWRLKVCLILWVTTVFLCLIYDLTLIP